MTGEFVADGDSSERREAQPEQFDELLKSWQSKLDAATPESIEAIANDAVNELDANCPFLDEAIYFRGRGLMPIITEDTHQYVGDEFRHTPGEFGVHKGMFVVNDVTTQVPKPKIMHLIKVAEASQHNTPTRHIAETFYAVMEQGTVIIPNTSVEEIYSPTWYEVDDPEVQPVAGINESAKSLHNLVSSTEFREFDHHQQQQTIEAELAKMNDATFGLVDKSLMLDPAMVFQPVIDDEKIVYVKRKLDDLIIATFLGVDTLDRVSLEHAAIRTDQDLIEPSGGLCIVVDPSEKSRQQLGLPEKQVLYVPVLGQNFECTFTE